MNPFPLPTESRMGGAPSRHSGSNRLALVSFLLSLAPLAVVVIVGGINEGLYFYSTTPGISSTVNLIIQAVSAVLWIVGLIGVVGGSISAIVTGRIALNRANHYPPQYARKGLATAGLSLGVLGLVIQVCIVVCIVALMLIVIVSLIQMCQRGC